MIWICGYNRSTFVPPIQTTFFQNFMEFADRPQPDLHPSYGGWTKCTSHHLETIGSHFIVGIYRGTIIPPFLRWWDMDFAHPQYHPHPPWPPTSQGWSPGPSGARGLLRGSASGWRSTSAARKNKNARNRRRAGRKS